MKMQNTSKNTTLPQNLLVTNIYTLLYIYVTFQKKDLRGSHITHTHTHTLNGWSMKVTNSSKQKKADVGFIPSRLFRTVNQ